MRKRRHLTLVIEIAEPGEGEGAEDELLWGWAARVVEGMALPLAGKGDCEAFLTLHDLRVSRYYGERARAMRLRIFSPGVYEKVVAAQLRQKGRPVTRGPRPEPTPLMTKTTPREIVKRPRRVSRG